MRLPIFDKFFRQNEMLGLDIQPGAACIAQIKNNKGTKQLVKASSCPLDPLIFTDDKVTHWDNLTVALYGWVRELELEGALVTVALPLSQLRLWSVKGVIQPNEAWLAHYLEQELPGLNDALVADYIVQPASVLVAAAKRYYVENYMNSLVEAGMQPKIIDVDAYAISRAAMMQDGCLPFLWQQRHTFTLIWQDESDLLQQFKWQVSSGSEAVSELAEQLKLRQITKLCFCGADYYANLFGQLADCTIHRYMLPFSNGGINLPDYLLAIGLAMREVPVW